MSARPFPQPPDARTWYRFAGLIMRRDKLVLRSERRFQMLIAGQPIGDLIPEGLRAEHASARWALRGFSAALRVDLRGTGVTVTDVVMSKVASTYWEKNPGSEERIPWIDRALPTLSVERAGEVVTRAVERERRLATAPAL